MDVVRRAWVSFIATIVGCLVLVPAAHAAFGFQGLSAAPTNTTAGAHSNLNIQIGFTSASDDVKDLTVSLPPGMVGNPKAAPLCTLAQLQGDSCPAGSQVGTTTANVTAHLLDPLPLNLPLTVNGSVYNVQPLAGQPARFGIVLRPIGSDPLPLLQKIIQVSDVRLRTTDFGLDTVLSNIPNTAHALGSALSVPTDINSIDLTLNGTVGGKDFLRNPTSCGTKTTKFTADSYANPTQKITGQASFTSVNCAALPFTPAFTATVGSPGHTQANTSPPVKTVISQGSGQAGLNTAQVLLPTSLNPSTDPLARPCPVAKFRTDPSTCPPVSIVGSARAISPYLTGAETGLVVIVAAAHPGELPRLGVDLNGQLKLQLFGSFVFTAQGVGQAFNGLPDIPISNFALMFKKDGLLFNSKNLCIGAPPAFLVSFVGWNGATISNKKVSATVNGCG
jgi:hypothetical protein